MRKKLLIIIILILIDQSIKIIISNFFICKELYFKKIIGFLPYLNESQLSIFNNEINLNLDITILSLINLLLIAALICFYFILKKCSNKSSIKYLNIMFVFLLSGTLCSFIDKQFYGGSLDYLVFGSIIIDLKDIYLLIGFCFYLIWAIKTKYQEIAKNKL